MPCWGIIIYMKRNLPGQIRFEFNDEQQQLYDEFQTELMKHIRMAKSQEYLLTEDFNRAIKYYMTTGMSLQQALERLNPEKLGGFYSHPAIGWYPLDNAAIIYPMSMRFKAVPMFRVSVYLKEEVVPEILQMALNFTIKRFPSFATTLKKGFFWHYLDSTKRRFSVEPEKIIPLRSLKIETTGSQSFRVVYYQNRISAELFHVLTDGSGGIVFLKTLTGEYLRLLGHDVTCSNDVLDIDEAPRMEETVNEFANSELKEGTSGFMNNSAAQMSGRISPIRPVQVLHFEMDSGKLLRKAREKNATVTSYLVSLMTMAARFACEENGGEIKIQVPVNMRKFNKSRTIRNYSMYFTVDTPLQNATGVDDIIDDVTQQIKEKSCLEEMSKMMSTTVKLVQSVKYIPLNIKKPVVRLVYGFLGDKVNTSFLSNLGVIRLPEDMGEYVEKFDFVLGPSDICRASCALVTFKDVSVLSITKITADVCFEEKLLQLLQKDGLEVDVKGSDVYES